MRKILFIAALICSISVSAQTMYYHKGKVYDNESSIYPIPTTKVEQNLYQQSAFLYSQYKSGKTLKTTGALLLGVGVPATVTSIILIPITYANRFYYRGYYYYDKHMYNAGWALFGIGVGLTSVGIPIYTVGLNKIKNSINAYNEEERSSLTFQIKDNGLGVALNF